MTRNRTSAEAIRAAIETRIRHLEEELAHWTGELERIAAHQRDEAGAPDEAGGDDQRSRPAPGRQGRRSASGS